MNPFSVPRMKECHTGLVQYELNLAILIFRELFLVCKNKELVR